jgi:hypothetical protein
VRFTKIIQVIKSRRMRRLGHVVLMRERKGAYGDLVGKSQGKIPLGRPRSGWEPNIKMGLQELGWSAWTGLIWLRLGTVGGLF